jgi:putative holliday junction resolvase
MKIAALDLGDVWIGIAIADPLGIVARPYKTVRTVELTEAINTLHVQEQVTTIVVGDPQTLRGTASQQTIKIREQLTQLQQQFPHIQWVLWDERLTSKQAASIQKGHTKEEKQKQHAIAAALILRSYLDRLAWQKEHIPHE